MEGPGFESHSEQEFLILLVSLDSGSLHLQLALANETNHDIHRVNTLF